MQDKLKGLKEESKKQKDIENKNRKEFDDLETEVKRLSDVYKPKCELTLFGLHYFCPSCGNKLQKKVISHEKYILLCDCGYKYPKRSVMFSDDIRG